MRDAPTFDLSGKGGLISYWVDPDYVPAPEPPPTPPGPQIHAPEIWFDHFNEMFGMSCSAEGCDWSDDKDPIGWADLSYVGDLTSSLAELHAMFGRHLAARFHGR